MNCTELEVGMVVQNLHYSEPLMVVSLNRNAEIAEVKSLLPNTAHGGWVFAPNPKGVKRYVQAEYLSHYMANR